METIYLTNAQVLRITAITIDTLYGVKLTSDTNDESAVEVEALNIDNPQVMMRYTVYPDGSVRVRN
jgi:hypothetical protein